MSWASTILEKTNMVDSCCGQRLHHHIPVLLPEMLLLTHSASLAALTHRQLLLFLLLLRLQEPPNWRTDQNWVHHSQGRNSHRDGRAGWDHTCDDVQGLGSHASLGQSTQRVGELGNNNPGVARVLSTATPAIASRANQDSWHHIGLKSPPGINPEYRARINP